MKSLMRLFKVTVFPVFLSLFFPFSFLLFSGFAVGVFVLDTIVILIRGIVRISRLISAYLGLGLSEVARAQARAPT